MSAPILKWHLSALMRQRGFRSTASLHRALEERGILISKVQLGRMAKELPVRLNTHLLHSLCAVLSCEPGDLLSLERANTKEKTRRSARKPGGVTAHLTDVRQLIGPTFQLRRTLMVENDD